MIRAYEKTVKIDICCISEGTWNQSRINQEPFTRICQVEINPSDKISPGNVAVREFVDYLERFISPTSIQELLEPSDIVGNIRFTHPTLYVFPGGEGDAALFGINGFNMLVDGGFSRKACFWNFVRHLDRLDGVLLTRINNSNMGGMSGIVQRKVCSHVYPQIGHFFSNLQVRKIYFCEYFTHYTHLLSYLKGDKILLHTKSKCWLASYLIRLNLFSLIKTCPQLQRLQARNSFPSFFLKAEKPIFQVQCSLISTIRYCVWENPCNYLPKNLISDQVGLLQIFHRESKK